MESVQSSSFSQKSNEVKKFQCTYKDCLKRFSTSSHLKRHENIHTNIIYRCEECDAIFSSQYNQKRHFDNKHLKKNPKKYKCDYCEEDFNKKSWLTRHVYRHTGILPYACTFENCKSRFLTPSKVKRHLKSHIGYSCPKENCSEKFAIWNELMSHLKIAHPIIHKCPECNQVFARSTNLKAHSMTHMPESDRPVFLCPKKGCQRSYYKKSNLRHHVRNYHGKRPFNCIIESCSKAFKSQERLDIHISKHSLSDRLKKEVLDDFLFSQTPPREIKDNLDDHISRQSSSEEMRKDDLDENVSRQSSSGEKKEDLDDHISKHSPFGRLKSATVVYLNKDSIC